jgi:prepilin-type N-terminal cleavage/methylation domain-containing protein
VPAANLQAPQATSALGEPLQGPRCRGEGGFTLIELLVSIAVLVLLVLLATQLLNSAATITTLGHKQMDADSQARQLLDRMAIDFAHMVKRNDVSYYVKTAGNAQPGNDQIAFFSLASGYYPTPSFQSPVSLIAYRINADSSSTNLARSYNKLERMGKGFIWNGVSATYTPIPFLDGATPPVNTIANKWPAATSSSATDADYEIAGPQVFRFEYYYLLTPDPTTHAARGLSAGALWASTNAFNIIDVAALVVDIAVIDPKSKVLLTVSQMEKLAGTNGQSSLLVDYTAGMVPGSLMTNWRNAVAANTISLPRPAISGIRVYERYFYLSPPTLGTL